MLTLSAWDKARHCCIHVDHSLPVSECAKYALVGPESACSDTFCDIVARMINGRAGEFIQDSFKERSSLSSVGRQWPVWALINWSKTHSCLWLASHKHRGQLFWHRTLRMIISWFWSLERSSHYHSEVVCHIGETLCCSQHTKFKFHKTPELFEGLYRFF